MPQIVPRYDAIDLIKNGAAGGNIRDWAGGPGMFYVEGTLGGATIKLQAKSPNDTWMDVPGASLTAPGMVAFDCPASDIQAVVTGGVGVTGLFVYVRPSDNRGG